MKPAIDRRQFVQASGLFLAGAAVPSLLGNTSRADAKQPGGRLRKALGWNMIQEKLPLEDKLRLIKDCGFEGVEFTSQAPTRRVVEPRDLARASEKTGVPIHGITCGANPDFKDVIDEAALYGATSVLHVARADAQAGFMEQYRKTQDIIRAAVPHAEKKRIPILVENVWATFLIDPVIMARYVDEFGSPFVKTYFDVGNVMRWGWPQHWIEVLGSRIGKIHVKEYSLKTAMKEGMLKGFDFPMGEGDIDWKRVCEELKRISYSGWVTAEVRGGDRKRLADISAQMDRILNLR